MRDDIIIYRKRHIPDECVKLKDDVVLKYDEDVIVTSWNCIRPREDIYRGLSVYHIKKGYKISKLYDANDNLVYWYCDIANIQIGEKENEILYEDMLLDVIIYPDNRIEVVDADEFAQALEDGMISKELAIKAMRSLNDLLGVLYKGNLKMLVDEIEQAEKQKNI